MTPVSSFSDPQFMDPINGDYRLLLGSPGQQAGIDILDLDQDGNNNDPIDVGVVSF